MNGIEPIDVEIVRTKMADMMRRGHVDICAIKDMIQLTGVIPDGKALERLRVLHCVDFANMTPALRLEIPRLLQLCLEGRPINYLYQPPTKELPANRLLS